VLESIKKLGVRLPGIPLPAANPDTSVGTPLRAPDSGFSRHCQLVDQPIQALLSMAYSLYENSHASQLIQESSCPCGDYQPRGLALFPVLPQRSRCRRTVVCAWRYGDLRSDAEVVPHVWPSVCESTLSPASPAWRHMAHGRGVPHNPEEALLLVAGGRSGRPRARYPGATLAGQAGCQEVVP